MTNDIIVGFRGKPEGLEAFLEENGYKLRREEDRVKVFEPKSDDFYPGLYYWPERVIEEEDEEEPFANYPDITSTLDINYHRDIEEREEADRIAVLVAKKFKGVYYDDAPDLYFEAEEL